ncbi:MAG: 30S ribosomal protein S7 [Candidatus Nitrosocaldaceae archaeon]
MNLLLFDKWDYSEVEVKDPGLKRVISLKPMIVPTSFGRHEHKMFGKSNLNVVERLVNKTMHFGKRFAKNTGRMAGKKARAINIVKTTFEIIHLKTEENPISVLVRAIENAAPNEDTTRIIYGGAVYHVSVDVSPLRRIDLALKFITDGAKEATFSSPKTIEEALADEIILASKNDINSFAIKKKNEQERVAMSSR